MMNDQAQTPVTLHHAAISPGTARDFFALLKPRVMSLVIFTALVGMLLAPVPVHPVIGFAALLAIAVGAGASGCLNMWWDADIDQIMARTARRPIPAGRVTREEALSFGMVLSFISVLVLGVFTNWFAAGFLAFTIFFYVVIYSMYLKRSTPQNIVIGGAAGAFPPMIGYAAVTGGLNLDTFILFGIIFLWTPPHFWALALVKSDDYARVGVPMLPVVAGPDATRLQIMLYTIILVPFAVLPSLLGFGGLAYGVTALVTGGLLFWCALRVYTKREGGLANRVAMQMFGFSILYLFLLFAVLLVERLMQLNGLPFLPWPDFLSLKGFV
jgi:protoheme IX farnesyltransferase